MYAITLRASSLVVMSLSETLQSYALAYVFFEKNFTKIQKSLKRLRIKNLINNLTF